METFFRYTLTLLISTVAGFQFVQVITRYVFETPVMGLEEVAVIPTLWLYILGAINASREDTQIRANVLDIFLDTERARHILLIISETLSIAISIWLTIWAWDYLNYAWRVWKETPTLYLPTFIYDSALFTGLLFMTLFTGWHLLKNIQFMIKGGPSADQAVDHDYPDTSEVAEFSVLDNHEEGRSRG
ncbi:TRAP transporter small permease [Neptuniibacter caesariensis]|uniref:TRAP transporter small permease protein n=1 Tax=Neptuniibacter caesariensis TaxID=207954 RepID=A0A7U8GSR5_NEPCE|nr:TRAP transporter small permease subunit [Neptuniibacter caesariensis]EAR61360.1 probable DctQ (C4-dicarboxylate permease, small subunit) [Oceanospirillum sp. MED92] [Neptuniibacter caesariensis]